MHHHHVVVCAAVLCSTAICFAQAQAPKPAEIKGTHNSQSAVVAKSSPDTAKSATLAPVVTDSSKTVKKADTAKTVQTAAVPPADTAKVPQSVDTKKPVKKADTVKTVQTAAVPPANTAKAPQAVDTNKTVIKTGAPSHTAKPASTAPSTPAVK